MIMNLIPKNPWKFGVFAFLLEAVIASFCLILFKSNFYDFNVVILTLVIAGYLYSYKHHVALSLKELAKASFVYYFMILMFYEIILNLPYQAVSKLLNHGIVLIILSPFLILLFGFLLMSGNSIYFLLRQQR